MGLDTCGLGAPEMGGVALASGTSACFYAIINCAKMGDNIVSARNLYGGTYTMFADILPTMGIDCTLRVVLSTLGGIGSVLATTTSSKKNKMQSPGVIRTPK